MDRLYYTPKEVAEILRISDDAVVDLVNRGDLPALRVSPRIIRIPVAGFDLWRSGSVPKRRHIGIRQATKKLEIGAGEVLLERSQTLRR